MSDGTQLVQHDKIVIIDGKIERIYLTAFICQKDSQGTQETINEVESNQLS